MLWNQKHSKQILEFFQMMLSFCCSSLNCSCVCWANCLCSHSFSAHRKCITITILFLNCPKSLCCHNTPWLRYGSYRPILYNFYCGNSVLQHLYECSERTPNLSVEYHFKTQWQIKSYCWGTELALIEKWMLMHVD